MSTTFLLSWDCLGLEAVVNITAYEKEKIWADLQDQPGPNLGSTIGHLMMRARANPQRHYEIYSINVEDDITENDLREMFERDPQQSADLVRKHGNKLYSDRVNQNELRIV